MALYKWSARKKIESTPYTAAMFEVSSGEGRRFTGRLETEFGAIKSVFNWTATYGAEGPRWTVIPVDGSVKVVGGVVVDKGFTKDAVHNRQIKLFIGDEIEIWRGGIKKPSLPQPPPTPSPPPKPPLPPKPAPPAPTPQAQDEQFGEVVLHIPLDDCVPFQGDANHPAFSGQPRKYFDPAEMQKLVGSIRKHGQKVPALVCRCKTIAGKWELIAGERRLRALEILRFPYIRGVEEKPESKQQQHMLALVENLFRVDPSPLELSDALQEQVVAGETQASLAEATSLCRATIGKLLSIQSVHPELKVLLGPEVPEEGRIRLEEAAVLAKIHPDHQVEIWNEAKGQPSHRLIVAKLHQLGRGLFQLKRTPRADRRNEAYEIKVRFTRRVNTLSLALIELEGMTPEEWRQFAVLLGQNEVSTEIKRLTELGLKIEEIKQRISRAKVAVKSSSVLSTS